MTIALHCNYKLPVKKYGGTQRRIIWLAQALTQLGHKVYLLASKGTQCEKVEVVEIDRNQRDLDPVVPDSVEVVHLLQTPNCTVSKPSLYTLAGNNSSGRQLYPNILYLSRDHARRHKGTHFVYNGLDPKDYLYREKKDDYFLYLSWITRKKGVDIAIALAKQMGFKLIIAGGWRPSFSRNVKYIGRVGGRRKAELLAGARALLFPIRWSEPFGIVTIEALISGTPVITTPRGSMSEIITPEVGFLCNDFEELKQAVKKVDTIDPQQCRRRVMENFTAEIMAKGCLQYYLKVIETGGL